MSKLVKKFDYNLNKNFYDAPFKAEPSTNRYEANKDLLYWLRFADGIRPQELSLAQNSANATYVGSVDNSESLIGNRNYSSLVLTANNYATFLDDSINFYDFNTVDAFTTSVWILPKQSPPFEDKILNFKYENTPSEFLPRISLKIKSTRRILINLTNISTDTFIPNNTGVGPLKLNEWNHVVFTYESSTTPDERIFNFYINGVQHGPYAVIRTLNVGIGHGPLTINCAPLNNNLIEVAELATWNRALTTDEVQAIYNATRGNSWVQASGFVSDSPRLELRDRDHATGSYPARSAHGMPDFNGRYGVQYFDNDAVDFTSNYAEGSIRFGSTPRLNTSLHLTGTYDQPEYKMRFQFTDYNQEPWKDLTTRYVVPLRTAGEDTISSSSVIRRLKDAINDSGIGLEATLVGTSSISLRHHVPFAAVDNSIRFTNPTIRTALLDVTSSQFRLGDDTESKVYPTMLPASSPWSDSGAIFPHEPSDIAAAGRSRKGIADSHVTFTPGQDLLPFSDSRLDIDESRQFYSEGTPSNELPGFSARLSSKDSFVIDINPEAEHEVYFSTGTLTLANPSGIPVHGGISYFNFHGLTRGWQRASDKFDSIEPAALPFTYELVDYTNSSFIVASSNSLLSTIPSTLWGFSYVGLPDNSQIDVINNIGNFGRPCSFAGFPQASKFDPTEEQKIRMSDYINGPFLLEKVVIEVSGVLSSYPPYSSSVAPYLETPYQNGYGNQVMIINTYDADINHDFESVIEHLTGTLSTTPTNPVERASRQASFNCRKLKDIVWYGRVGSYANDSEIVNEEFKAQRTYQTDEDFFQSPFGRMYDSVYPVKTNIAGGIFEGLGSVIEPYNFHTGTIRVEAPTRTSGISLNSSFARILRTSTEPDGEPVSQERTFLFGESKGGRKLLEVSSDRSYVKGIGGTKRLADADYSYRPTDEGTVSLERYSSEESLASPYVLMPTDELTIAWVNQPYPLPGATYDALPEGEHNTATVFRTKLSPGVGRVTFYGSYLRDAQPLPPETSQPLTSNAVHEDVRDDASPYGEARCMDQFLVEPRLTYSGSYLDTKRLTRYIDGENATNFIKIASGWNHELALDYSGNVYAWGDNGNGQLGQGDTTPLEYPTIVDFGVPGLKFTDIAAGREMSCALDANGNVWMWGKNENIDGKGILGLNNTTDSYVVVPDKIKKMVRPLGPAQFGIIELSDQNIIPKVTKVFSHASSEHFIGLIDFSQVPDAATYKYTNVLMWGANFGLPVFNNDPDVASETSDPIFEKPTLMPYQQVTAGNTYYWFRRNNRDLIDDEFPDQTGSGIFALVPNRKRFESAAVGKSHAMLLMPRGDYTNNRLYSYGLEAFDLDMSTLLGQAGYVPPTGTYYKKIMHVSLFGNDDEDLRVLQIAAGKHTSYAIIGEKTQVGIPPLIISEYYKEKFVYSWGDGTSGKLGHGDTNDQADPQTSIRYFLDQPMPNSIAAGADHVVAIYNYENRWGRQATGPNFTGTAPDDDIVWAWGEGSDYRLGNNSTDDKDTPQEVKRFGDWQRAQSINVLSAGSTGNFLVRDGGFWAWGKGKLGVGDPTELAGTDSVEIPKEYDPDWNDFLTKEYIGSAITDQYQKSSLQRFFRANSSSETFYDSHVPFIKDIAQRANIRIENVPLTLVNQSEGLVQAAYLHLPGTNSKDHVEVANWILSFPFAPLFEGVERVDSPETANGADNTDKTAIDTFIITGSNGVLDKTTVVLDTLRKPGPFAQFPLVNTFARVATARTLVNLFYSFGDFAGRLPIDSSKLKQGAINVHGFDAGDFYYLNENKDPELLVTPRGFKYGLANTVPLPRSATFRCDSYGQFRDMLEQGLDSAFFVKDKLDIKWFPGEEKPKHYSPTSAGELLQSPVFFRFVSRVDGSVVDPLETNSQNLSTFATSSVPYFDGDMRDRTTLQPDMPNN